MFLENFSENLNIAVIGASGGIGTAFLTHLVQSKKVERLYSFSRHSSSLSHPLIVHQDLDLTDEMSIERAARSIPDDVHLDLVILATGILHDEGLQPEKGLRDLSLQNFHDVFAVNSFGPAIVMKYFLPKLHKDKRSVFAALSARVGSVSDNNLGGWYAYRASKTALNMLIKNAAIEMGRRYKHAVIIGIHPGTVDTNLSKPFQGNVPNKKLFTPNYSAEQMLNVMNKITVEQSGKIFDYAGEEIVP